MITLRIVTSTFSIDLHYSTGNAQFVVFIHWIMICQFHTDVISFSHKYMLCMYSGHQTKVVCRTARSFRQRKNIYQKTSFPEHSNSFYDINKQFYYSTTIFRFHHLLFRMIRQFVYWAVYQCKTLKKYVFKIYSYQHNILCAITP